MGRTKSAASRRVKKNQEERRLKWNSSLTVDYQNLKGQFTPKIPFLLSIDVQFGKHEKHYQQCSYSFFIARNHNLVNEDSQQTL